MQNHLVARSHLNYGMYTQKVLYVKVRGRAGFRCRPHLDYLATQGTIQKWLISCYFRNSNCWVRQFMRMKVELKDLKLDFVRSYVRETRL